MKYILLCFFLATFSLHSAEIPNFQIDTGSEDEENNSELEALLKGIECLGVITPMANTPLANTPIQLDGRLNTLFIKNDEESSYSDDEESSYSDSESSSKHSKKSMDRKSLRIKRSLSAPLSDKDGEKNHENINPASLQVQSPLQLSADPQSQDNFGCTNKSSLHESTLAFTLPLTSFLLMGQRPEDFSLQIDLEYDDEKKIRNKNHRKKTFDKNPKENHLTHKALLRVQSPTEELSQLTQNPQSQNGIPRSSSSMLGIVGSLSTQLGIAGRYSSSPFLEALQQNWNWVSSPPGLVHKEELASFILPAPIPLIPEETERSVENFEVAYRQDENQPTIKKNRHRTHSKPYTHQPSSLRNQPKDNETKTMINTLEKQCKKIF